MFYIIETQEQLQKFSTYDLSESFIEPILYSDNVHPVINRVSAYFIKPSRSRTGFILPVNHSETFRLDIDVILSLFEARVSKVYVSDIKRTRSHLPINKPLICLKTLKWLETGEILDDKKYNTPAHNFFYAKYPDKYDVNRIVPICKHQEKWNNFLSDNKKLLSSKIEGKRYFKFYNQLVNNVLLSLEYEGLQIDASLLSKHYPEAIQNQLVADSRVYTHYNIHTATGRPSNAFGGVNFAAMNKSDNSREFIISSKDWLVEYDYHSYHPRILSNLIGYSFEGDDIHSHLGRMYFDVEELTKEQYSESKHLTFKLLYTNADDYMHIEFFRRVRDYKESLWRQYREKGYLESIISKKPIKGIESKTQILPYLLQSYETERNMIVMKELQEYLADKETKLILYSYDAFLIDFSKADGSSVLTDIQGILEIDGFTTSMKFGKNYAELKELSH